MLLALEENAVTASSIVDIYTLNIYIRCLD